MATRLFVGSLAYTVNDEELAKMFEEAGAVVSAKVIIDREQNKSKGFGFVEMGSEDEAANAIKIMHNKEVGGRQLTVNEAKPMPERNNGGNFGDRARF